jgi:signal transduction histidine kinase
VDSKPQRPLLLASFQAGIVLPTLAFLAYLAISDPDTFRLELGLWAITLFLVELLPVPFWRGMQLSMGFPILVAVALIFQPGPAALVAFAGSVDPRELKRDVSALRALFNRSQVALSVLAASAVFHTLATVQHDWPRVLGAAFAATVADYAVNLTVVAAAVAIAYRTDFVGVLKRMRIGQGLQFLVNYVGLAFVGAVLAKLYHDPAVRAWALPAVLAPLTFARQMFFRSLALEDAHKELQAREQVLEQLSNRMAEERQDERAQIAAYLHDDLAQLLFRLSLQVDIAKRHLRNENATEVEKDLEAIRETKNRTNDLVRALIRDLHRSPLGRAGLAEALKSFTADVGSGSGVNFSTEIADLPLPPPIALLIYHISREAVMNALKHAGADNISVLLGQKDDVVQLTIKDDGVGFDTEGPGPEGHFGMTMMRERAQVAGGTFEVTSAPGEGTTITVSFATSWLDEESLDDQDDDGPSSSLTEPPPTREVKNGLVPPPAVAERPEEVVPA